MMPRTPAPGISPAIGSSSRLGQCHALAAGEAVAGGDDQRQCLFVQQQALLRHRHLRADADQGQVQPAFAQVVQQGVAHGRAQVHIHVRMCAAEAVQQRRHLHRGERGDLPQREPAAHGAQRLGHFFMQALGRAQRLPRVVQKHLAGGGGAHLAGAAFEQARAQQLLDLGDLVAERGLHGVAAARGRSEAAFVGHRHGELQLAQGQHAISKQDGNGENNTLERWPCTDHTAPHPLHTRLLP